MRLLAPLAVALLAGRATAHDDTPPSAQAGFALLEGGPAFPWWELGQIGGNNVPRYAACFQVGENLTDIPPGVPCTGLRLFYANCTYGISLQGAKAEDPTFLDNPFEKNGARPFAPLDDAAQQQCYCSGAYWDYVRGCNACMRQHGFDRIGAEPVPLYAGGSSAPPPANWVPADWVDQQSSAYCGVASPTHDVLHFLAAFSPTGSDASLATATASAAVSTPAPTGGSALATTDHTVAHYYTLQSTVASPTQTIQTGSLVLSATPTFTPPSSTAAAPAAATAPVGFLGLTLSLIAVLV